jgi:hypothetical protein
MARAMISPITATARIPNTTQTHVGTSSVELEPDVVVAGMGTRRVVVCCTVVTTVVPGAVVVVGIVVVVVSVVTSWAPPVPRPTPRRIPAVRRAASAAIFAMGGTPARGGSAGLIPPG